MAEDKKIDETVPGGRYIVGDQTVNAHGEVIKGASSEKTVAETSEASGETVETPKKGKK